MKPARSKDGRRVLFELLLTEQREVLDSGQPDTYQVATPFVVRAGDVRGAWQGFSNETWIMVASLAEPLRVRGNLAEVEAAVFPEGDIESLADYWLEHNGEEP